MYAAMFTARIDTLLKFVIQVGEDSAGRFKGGWELRRGGVGATHREVRFWCEAAC